MERWCKEVGRETGESWRYLKVSQGVFQDFSAKGPTRSFDALIEWRDPQRKLLDI